MRFIWGHALTRVSITGWCVLWRYTYFFCAWQRGPSWGWPTMWLILPYVYAHLLVKMEYSHLFVLFLKVFHNLDIFLHCLLIRVIYGYSFEVFAPFLRVLLFLNVSNVFGGGSKVVSNSSHNYHKGWLVCTIISPLVSLLLSTGLWPYDPFSGGAYMVYCFSLSFLWW